MYSIIKYQYKMKKIKVKVRENLNYETMSHLRIFFFFYYNSSEHFFFFFNVQVMLAEKSNERGLNQSLSLYRGIGKLSSFFGDTPWLLIVRSLIILSTRTPNTLFKTHFLMKSTHTIRFFFFYVQLEYRYSTKQQHRNYHPMRHN